MYEHALRKTDNLMDELQPEQKLLKKKFPAQINDHIYEMSNLDIAEPELKPVKSRAAKKKQKAKNTKAKDNYEPIKVEAPQEMKIQQVEEDNNTCP